MHYRFLPQLSLFIILLSFTESWWLPRSYSGTSRAKNHQTKSSNILAIAKSKIGSSNWSLIRSWHQNLWYIKEDKGNILVYNILLKAHKFAPNRSRSLVPFSIAGHLLIRKSLESTNSTPELNKRTKRSSRRTRRSSRRTSGSSRRTSGSSRRTIVSRRRTSGLTRTSGSSRRTFVSTRRTSGLTRRTSGSTRRTYNWWRRRTTGSKGRTTGSKKKPTGSRGRKYRKNKGKKSKSSSVVSKLANKNIGSTSWNYDIFWKFRPYTKNKYKCNFFVNDVLIKAGVKVPSRRKFINSPISANEWANPKSTFVLNTNMYDAVPFEKRKPGDIIAFRREGKSGHMGIVSSNGNFISAGKFKVFETSVDGFRNDPDQNIKGKPTVWRIKEKP